MNVRTTLLPRDRRRGDSEGAFAGDYLGGEAELARGRQPRPAIDLATMTAAVRRNRWLIAAIVLVALLAAYALSRSLTPTYTAQATVQVEQRATRVTGTEDADPGDSAATLERFLQTQVSILESRALTAQVVDAVQLPADAGLRAAIDVTPDPTGRVGLRDRTIDRVQALLGVSLPPDSQIVAITFSSRGPQASARIANAFAEQFVRGNLQRRFDQSAYARGFLERQLGRAKARLEQSERALNGYARSARLIDGGGARDAGAGQTPSLIGANLVQVNTAYAAARSNRLQLQQRWQQVRSAPALTLPEVLGNPAIQQLSARKSELQAQYQQERQRHKTDYPTVQQAAAQLAELDRQIDAIADNIRRSIHDAYLIAQRQETAAAADLNNYKAQAFSEQDRGVRYTILRREADTNRQLYDALLQRYKQLSSEAGATNNNVAVVDRADPPTRSRQPRLALVFAVALIVGLLLSAVVVIAREVLDDTVRTLDHAERRLGLPLLGIVPLVQRRVGSDPGAVGPRSRVAEAYQSLRGALELSVRGQRVRSVAVTSSREGEGKSTTALALARASAGATTRVLLVDADLRKPSLHRRLNLINAVGLSQVLAGEADWTVAVQATPIAGLDFVGSGTLPANPAALLANASLAVLIDEWHERYDLVVIDGPPVLGLADAPRLAALVDYALFVIEAGRAQGKAVLSAAERLQGANVRRLGYVLTKVDPRLDRAADDLYGYGYGEYLRGAASAA